MTVKDAAGRLGLGESSVYALAQSGRLRCYRHVIRAGGRPRIDIGEHHLAEYLASVETPEPASQADATPAVAAAETRRGRGARPVDWVAEAKRLIRERA